MKPVDADQHAAAIQRSKPTRPLRVLMAGKLTALVSPGGGEVQMERTRVALRELDVDAQPWRPWEQRLAEADVLHLFGSQPEHVELAESARRLNIPVVLSTVAWFDLASLWHEPWSLWRRVMACGRFALRAALPAWPSWRRRLYHACDRLLPNSLAEADQLTRLFQVPAARIRAVPNGADERFALGDPTLARELVGHDEPFALYCGRIEPRKNQLGFLQAMQRTGVPIVIVGDVVTGQQAYLDACRRVAGPNVKFLGRVEHDSPLMASLYAACGCLTLASWFETPGLVALEAGMSGVPLVLPRGGCAAEYFGPLATYVAAHDLRAIREQTLLALQKRRDPRLAQLVRDNYTWRNTAQATRDVYAELV